MKTWFTYIAALFFAAATAFLFADYEIVANTIAYISGYLINIATLVTLPVLVFSFTTAIASLRKDKMGGNAASSIIIWTLLTGIILPFIATGLFYLYPTAFPVTSSAGSSGDMAGYYVNYSLYSNLNALNMANPFNVMATASTVLLPLLILCWIFGAFLNPTSDQIRPAYAVMNSFSEVMHKIARFYTQFGYIICYFALSDLFLSTYIEKTLIAVPSYLIKLLIIASAAIFVALPLLFSICTRFRRNPYKALYLSLSSLLMGLSSGNIISVIPANITSGRLSLGEQKRHAVASSYFFALFAKGGSAAISTYLSLTLITAMGGVLDLSTMVIITLTVIAVSFISSASFGMESIFITYLALKLLKIDLYGAESALLSILMVTNGIGTMLDAAIMALGSKVTAVRSKTEIEIPYKDYV